MKNEIIDFNKIADGIPVKWCSEADILKISKTILENLKNAMDLNVNEAAKLVDCTPGDILETLQDAANIYSRMIIFEEKFGQIVEQFPRGEAGEINYPDKILAKIFGVNIEAAVEIFQNHFGLGSNDHLAEMITHQK
ncbi:MAG: hypothetical protein HOD92_02015 [Deltaproteobacteria bacterium]|jgi:hypothetical protein|nr:hypothetical protein [Deltaproteobacteria bacterium]MBT4526982.1 hypothetical protein [Deltaproteobacteria bacterium]